MINIKLNVEGAYLMIDIFKEAKNKGKVNENKVNELMKLKVMNYLIEHYNIPQGSNAGITKDDVHKILMNLANDNFVDENEFLIKMHKNYREKLENLEPYVKTLKKLEKCDVNKKAEKRLMDYLPHNMDFDSSVYIILTGRSGGYFNGEDMTLDLAYISEDTNNKYVDTIAHELHHIGFSRIYNEIVDEGKLSLKNRMIYELLSGLIGEGVAYYCIGGIPEEGERGYKEYLGDIKNEAEHFKEVSDTLKNIIDGELDNIDKFMEWASKHMSQMFGAINYIGIKTVEAIHQVYGNKGILHIMTIPNEFISKYNEAASALNKEGKHLFIFDKEVEEGVKEFLN